MYDSVIKNGTIVNSGSRIDADLAIAGGKVRAIGSEFAADREIDASGCLVIPGGVDPHVHLQMPLAGRVSSDTFATGTLAAALGGTTTVIDFVVPEANQSMLEALSLRRAEADGEVFIDYGLHMTIPAWHAADIARLREVGKVVAAGCRTFKLYQAYDGMALDDVSLFRVLKVVGSNSGLVVLHSEVGPVLEKLRTDAIAEGHVGPIWHAYTRPARLEATAVYRAVELATLAGCPLHVFHIGCREVVEQIVSARANGMDVTGETCPQYLLLTAREHLDGKDGSLFVCAPPLRDRADQERLWHALVHGELDMVSTDHCPWTRAEKAQALFTEIPGGVPGIEARLSLVYHHGVKSGSLSLEQWIEVCSHAPAQRMGLRNKGALLPGYDADVVIFDPAETRRLSTTTLHEHVDWTPYDGMPVSGWARTVLLRGQVIVEDGQPVGSPMGKFVIRSLSIR